MRLPALQLLTTVDTLVALLERHRYTVTCERELHEAIAVVLTTAGIEHRQEVRLSARDRPDFMVDGIVLEAKVSSWSGVVLRQVTRYLEHPEVTGLVLVTTRRRHSLPLEVSSKPVRVAFASGA